MSPNKSLEELRNQIDELDRDLVDLLARRLNLVTAVGEVKRAQGLPIYMPEREAAMIAGLRNLAKDRDLSAEMVEDVFRRIMRESYSAENEDR